MKWPSIGSDDGETVDATPDDQGEVRTEVLPSFVDIDNYTEKQLNVLKYLLSHYEATADDIIQELGVGSGTISNTKDKFLSQNWSELVEGGLGYHHHIDAIILKAKNPEYTKEQVENELGTTLANGTWSAIINHPRIEEVKEVETNAIPKFVDLDAYPQNQLKVLNYMLDNYKSSRGEAVDECGVGRKTVQDAMGKFVERNWQDLLESGVGYHYLIDAKILKAKNPDMGITDISEELGVRIQPGAWGSVLSDDLVMDQWDNNQLDAETNDTMTEDNTDSKKAAELVVDKLNTMDELDGRVEELATAIDDQGDTIDDLVEIYNENLREEESDTKRYVGDNPTITLELTEFEAMFLAQRLWEAGEMYEGLSKTTVEEECKWWSRKLHGERNTRQD